MENNIKNYCRQLISDQFHDLKMESSRKEVGAGTTTKFEFEGKKYIMEYTCFWEKADWAEYTLSGDGFDYKETDFFDI